MSSTSSAPLQIGDEILVSRTCGPYDPLYYAAASGDFNQIHIDREVGEKAGLGGVILHGMCTMAWAVEAIGTFTGDATRLSKIRVRFSRPVKIGETITFRGKITSIAHGRATGELHATNDRGEDILRAATFELTAPEVA